MIYLVRHGESVANKDGVLCGQMDSPLTDKGYQQAIDAGYSLEDVRFDAVYSSDLRRAIDTATLIMSKNKIGSENINTTPILRERSGGDFEGKTYSELREVLPPKRYKLWQRDYFEAPAFGESMMDVRQRLMPFIRDVLVPALHDDKTILVVSHATVMKVLVGHIKKMDETEIPKLTIENAVPYTFASTTAG